MALQIDPATPHDIFTVASAMRDSDFREFSAFYAGPTKLDIAYQLVMKYGNRDDVIVASDGGPIAVGGLLQARPNVITLWMLATDDFPRIGLGLTRFLVKRMIPPLVDAGVHRIECASIEGYATAHTWIRALGLRQEAVMPGYGQNGETFIQFAWVKDVCKTCD